MEGTNERRINYRELQSIAKGLNLPGNLKYHLLVEIIEARKVGNESVVERILSDQKLERVRRKKEKLEAREAAYQHLKITGERRLMSKYRKSSAQTPTPTSECPAEVSKLWDSQGTCNNNIMSYLTLPVQNFTKLLRKTREQVQATAYNSNGAFYYSDYHENVGQKWLMQQNQASYLQKTVTPKVEEQHIKREKIDAFSNCGANGYNHYSTSEYPDYSLQLDQQNHLTSRKASFQMKDILGQNDENWYLNHGQNYYMGNAYDMSQSSIGDSHSSPYMMESAYHSYSSYMPSADDCRNMYDINQGYNRCYMDCNGVQDTSGCYMDCNIVEGTSGSSSEVMYSSRNSDTVSASNSDEDDAAALDKSENAKNNNNIVFPPSNYYFSSPPSLNTDLHDQPWFCDLNTIDDGSELQDKLAPVDRDMCYLSVVDHEEWVACEYSTEIQSSIIHSVSSHSYVGLN